MHDIVGQEYPVIQHGKTKGFITTIPAPNMAIDLLKDIQGYHLSVKGSVDKDLFPNDEGWVFLNSYGKLINTGWINWDSDEEYTYYSLSRIINNTDTFCPLTH